VKEFKGEWREPLEKEGCKILVSDFLGRSCFLIRKPNNGMSQSENNSQNEPCENSNQNQHRKPWSKEETEKLKKLFMEGKSYSELAEIFHRNKKAIQQKLYDMGLKRESVKPNPTLKPNPKPESNPNSNKNNEVEAKVLIEACLQLLPSYPQAAKILLQQALNRLQS